MTKKTRAEWMEEKSRLDAAVHEAEQIVQVLGLKEPVNPLAVVESEAPFLKAAGDDIRNRYDGQLEYHRKKNRFLLYFNTKYDHGRQPGDHHPRTRFSIAHELGHYYLAAHRAYLMHGGQPHRSSSEFRNNVLVEREADAFASGLLLPTHLFQPVVNEKGELSSSRVLQMADDFRTSFVSTVIRAVRLSDYPCGVVGIRDGKKAWSFASESLIEAGAYPSGKGKPLPKTAGQHWARFERGEAERVEQDGRLWDWFQTYENDDLGAIWVTEGYVPVPILETLVVLVTADPNDIGGGGEDDESDEEEGYLPSWER